MSRCLLARCGYRGAWLILLGTFWLLFGIGTLLSPEDSGRSWALIEYVPPLWQALVWWITGLVAIGVGWRGHRRDDALGHVALYVMPAVKVMSYLVAAFVYATTTALHAFDPSVPVTGWAASWYAAAVWALVSIMLGLGAAWPNPTPPLPEPPSTAGDEE